MRKMRSGQTVLIDLTFAFIIFAMIFLALNSFYADKIVMHNDSVTRSEMAVIANSASDSLLKTRGIPENWHTLPIEQVSQIGLLGKGSSIDADKLNAFRNLISDYNTTKELLGLKNYDYFFRLKASPDINAGLSPMSLADKVAVARAVNYNEVGVDAEFTLYRLR